MDLELMPFPGHEPKEQVLDDTPMRIGALEFGVMLVWRYSSAPSMKMG
jgi:hypothetical protein